MSSSTAPIVRVPSAPPALLGLCTPKRILDIPGLGLVPTLLAHGDPLCSTVLGPTGRHRRAGLGDPPHPRVLAHLPGLWDSCVCSARRSESLLCFVCPRQLCWIQLGLCCISLARESNRGLVSAASPRCLAARVSAPRAGQGGFTSPQSHQLW